LSTKVGFMVENYKKKERPISRGDLPNGLQLMVFTMTSSFLTLRLFSPAKVTQVWFLMLQIFL